MPKLGEPPAPSELARVEPDVKVVEAGTELWRIYFRGGRHPTLWSEFRAFGPTDARFDHHLSTPDGEAGLQERAILYASTHVVTCVAEVFQRSRIINRLRGNPWIVGFALKSSLVLLDLTGRWPTRTGRASAAINVGSRARARRWSQAIYEAYPNVQGLYYASSMNALSPCLALYERARAAGAMPERPSFHRSLSDPTWETVLKNAAADLSYRLQ
ncbi:MAG: RES family NAD+ phosphorylase [Deltaproteobacteria bacterium]|nr:RES family NAD+ phosphorylase [Deltaproteobacteria bacterium]